MEQNTSMSKGIDWLLVWIYIILVCVGIISIFAASYREGENIIQGFLSFKTEYSKQLLYFGISGILATFILLIDSKFFTATANLWYAFGIALLILVFPFHTAIKGTNSIIRFGSFNLQPAELCKVFVNLALAKYLSRVETNFHKTRSQLIAASIAILPAILSIMQHETGLALVYFSFFLVMFREGLPAAILIVGFTLAVLVVATLLVEPNILAIILTAIALLTILIMKRQIRRSRQVLFYIITIWAFCVGVQRFAVPFI